VFSFNAAVKIDWDVVWFNECKDRRYNVFNMLLNKTTQSISEAMPLEIASITSSEVVKQSYERLQGLL